MRNLLSLILALTVHAQVPEKYCPLTAADDEYFVVNNTCYYVTGTLNKDASWIDAHNECKYKKGSLLFFKDKSNEDAVIGVIRMSSTLNRHLYWLELKRDGHSWKWTTGADLTYSPDWETGSGDCAVVNVAQQKWSPRTCSDVQWDIGYICQYVSGVSSSRIKEDAAILLTLTLTLYRIFGTDI